MKVVTYLGFTLLSILIQFCVMDFIQEMNRKGNNLNVTSQKRKFRDVLKDFNQRPALYYQIKKERIYSNTTLPDILFDNTTTTEISTTVFDILLYDDNNVSTTEESLTTDNFFTTAEYDNVTEISFFGKNNETTVKPDIQPRKQDDKCACNFLYKVCDINCCCDFDCTQKELKLFPKCNMKQTNNEKQEDGCINYLTYFGYGSQPNIFDNLFCVVKSNVPKKKTEQAILSNNFNYNWKSNNLMKKKWEFTNKLYNYGDPVWLLRNGTIYYMDSPSQTVNSYCNGRKTILFLKDETYGCKVKFGDLEMFQFIRNLNETYVISATPMNATVLNCSSLHCVNWTILVCTYYDCTSFNKSQHEPFCTDSICANLALDLDYTFYYKDSKIIKATITFHVQNVSIGVYYTMQNIRVRFIMANESVDKILKLSGNPGYLEHMPVIVSNAKINYTEIFFNKTEPRYIFLPINEKGKCLLTNITKNVVMFGINKRIACKFYQKYTFLKNRTKECSIIQEKVIELMNLQNYSVSPLGNPKALKDKDWLKLQCLSTENNLIYGNFNRKTSILDCYNIITRFSLIFSVGNIKGNNKILAAECDYTMKNLSLSIEEDSVGINLVVDISFKDITKPSVFDEVSPNLDLHFPHDLFYPFPSSKCPRPHVSKLIILILFVIECFLQIK